MFNRILSISKQTVRTTLNAPGLLVNNWVQKRLTARIRQAKKNHSLEYVDGPSVTAVIQFFNKKNNIERIITNLILSGVREIIAIDDGSIDGSYEVWPRLLNRKNDFLLRCNDIYEIRAYDRAIRMSNGDITVLLQDDDIPPGDSSWLDNALSLFANFPKMTILGGLQGVSILPADPGDANIIYPTEDVPIYSYPGLHKYEIISKPQFIDPKTRIPFQFVETVNRAPMLIRTKIFLEEGGMPMEYAPVMGDDAAVSLRTWKQGGQVGLYQCNFQRNVSRGGIREFNQGFAQKQAGDNWRKLYSDYSKEIANGEIRESVRKNNNEYFIENV